MSCVNTLMVLYGLVYTTSKNRGYRWIYATVTHGWLQGSSVQQRSTVTSPVNLANAILCLVATSASYISCNIFYFIYHANSILLRHWLLQNI
jgi:hypothetical protein